MDEKSQFDLNDVYYGQFCKFCSISKINKSRYFFLKKNPGMKIYFVARILIAVRKLNPYKRVIPRVIPKIE